MNRLARVRRHRRDFRAVTLLELVLVAALGALVLTGVARWVTHLGSQSLDALEQSRAVAAADFVEQALRYDASRATTCPFPGDAPVTSPGTQSATFYIAGAPGPTSLLQVTWQTANYSHLLRTTQPVNPVTCEPIGDPTTRIVTDSAYTRELALSTTGETTTIAYSAEFDHGTQVTVVRTFSIPLRSST